MNYDNDMLLKIHKEFLNYLEENGSEVDLITCTTSYSLLKYIFERYELA